MSLISVTDVTVLNNPASFTSPFQFEISFECIAPVKEELEWKLVYVGSAENEKYDQELDSVLVGPIIVGKNKFVFECNPPDHKAIPQKDLMEVTVLLLTCAYKEKEFIRIGYYVNNEYPLSESGLVQARDTWLTQCAQLQHDYATQVSEIKAREEAMRANGELPESESLTLPPQPVLPTMPDVDVSKLIRNILADKPRVTRFQIPWDQVDQQQEYAMDAADEDEAKNAAAEVEAKASEGVPVEEDEEEEEDEDEEMEDGDVTLDDTVDEIDADEELVDGDMEEDETPAAAVNHPAPAAQRT